MTTNEKYWLGFDLGGSKMLAIIYDETFQPCGRRRKKTKGHEGQESVVSRMQDVIRDALEDAKIEVSQLSGIGVGVPGPIDEDKGIVLEAVNLGWENVPLAEVLGKELNTSVVVLNDVDAGIYGEYRFGAAKDSRTALGVFPGTGIGGGCVYNGEIIHGQGISCMELGHIQVTENGHLCGCGRRGCLETEASRLAISAEVAMAAYRGETPNLVVDSGTDLSRMRSGALARAIAAGDTVVEDIIRRAAQVLGVGVANVVMLVAPDTVVLGGGMVEEMPEVFVQTVTKAANERVMSSFVGTFRVVVAELGDNAGVMGAAAWAQKTVQEASSGMG
jgi:glucokinase